MSSQESSWLDWKYPKWRNANGLLTIGGWLKGRREEDGAEGLWRVHDNLYDLSSWVHSHPGGSEWLTVTKGTDITEAFEIHHLRPLASKTIAKFYVRPAKTNRNSAFTFKPDGFYQILKSRAYEKLKNATPGPSWQSKLILDSLATTTILLSVLSAIYQSFVVAAFAGFFLAQMSVVAHNFFHMRDNWRMYFFNMTLLTVREWRVSHALSHHVFPNTHYDLEISMGEPFLDYLPKTDKNKTLAIFSVLYSPIIYPFVFFSSAIKRLFTTWPQPQDLIGLVLPISMVIVSQVYIWICASMVVVSVISVLKVITIWIFLMMSGSFVFGVIGVNAAHHHPDIFHYGDKPRDDRDWGLFTLDATRDRVEISSRTYLVLTTFGDHTLHHLFPAIDHVHLHKLYPELEETCKEFGIDFKFTTTLELVKGQFQQLLRTEPNLKERSY